MCMIYDQLFSFDTWGGLAFVCNIDLPHEVGRCTEDRVEYKLENWDPVDDKFVLRVHISAP